ncbi:hypothetical protein F383_04793 [Gossypium arboreum]|uniref:Uncharacterized protein n=1 Tax=Gossypium arboreum TaxID=29729 RepID=A0A0B0NQL0_GOSAR|nr:hypothetical protein F383_04793 [Gossypium arboreum]
MLVAPYSGCNLFFDCKGTPKSFVLQLLLHGSSRIVKELWDVAVGEFKTCTRGF